jgi:hypothetical protein
VQQTDGVLEIVLARRRAHALLDVLGTSFLEGTLEVVASRRATRRCSATRSTSCVPW